MTEIEFEEHSAIPWWLKRREAVRKERLQRGHVLGAVLGVVLPEVGLVVVEPAAASAAAVVKENEDEDTGGGDDDAGDDGVHWLSP